MAQTQPSNRVPEPDPLPSTTHASTGGTSASSARPGPSPAVPGGALKLRRPRRAGPAASRAEKSPETQTAEEPSEIITPLDGVDAGDMPWMARNQWMVYAVASGACAAFNGVFAKLTTNNLTSHIARGISGLFGLEGVDKILEIVVRCMFFGLNLFFNGVMWTLFTQALAKGHSTTQVSIMNTSTNFMITALLGFAIFAEALPPLWWAGATLLVAGNVVIGRKDESAEGERSEGEDAETGRVGVPPPEFKDGDEDEDVPLLGDLDSPPRGR